MNVRLSLDTNSLTPVQFLSDSGYDSSVYIDPEDTKKVLKVYHRYR